MKIHFEEKHYVFDTLSFSIPIFSIEGKNKNRTVLITAGMDGDEYSGIDAAYKLIDNFAHTVPTCSLIVIPTCNIPGMMQRVSWNPIDNKYPKHILPGKKDGTATEQMMHWLYETFLQTKKIQLWIDLHCGASNETLIPFVATKQTKNMKINNIVKHIISCLPPSRVVYEKYSQWTIPHVAAKHDIAYVLLESGQLGLRKKEFVTRHTRWVQSILNTFTSNKIGENSLIHIYRKINEYYAPEEGLWYPSEVKENVTKGDIIGTITNSKYNTTREIVSPLSGIYLWGKHDIYCKKKEFLFAIATEKEMLQISS